MNSKKTNPDWWQTLPDAAGEWFEARADGTWISRVVVWRQFHLRGEWVYCDHGSDSVVWPCRIGRWVRAVPPAGIVLYREAVPVQKADKTREWKKERVPNHSSKKLPLRYTTTYPDRPGPGWKFRGVSQPPVMQHMIDAKDYKVGDWEYQEPAGEVETKKPSLLESAAALHSAGGSEWDAITDPQAAIQEMRGIYEGRKKSAFVAYEDPDLRSYREHYRQEIFVPVPD